MSAIFRPPVGLQSLLDTKAVGRNPADLAQIIQPTLDVVPFLRGGLSLDTVGSGAVALGATGLQVFATVPPGEVWFVIGGWSRITNTAVGDACRFAVALAGPDAALISLAGALVNSTNIQSALAVYQTSDSRLLITPGWRLGILVTDLTVVGSVTASCAFTVQRLLV